MEKEEKEERQMKKLGLRFILEGGLHYIVVLSDVTVLSIIEGFQNGTLGANISGVTLDTAGFGPALPWSFQTSAIRGMNAFDISAIEQQAKQQAWRNTIPNSSGV
jgi:hypothetical protein